jgi:hypothetical protein
MAPKDSRKTIRIGVFIPTDCQLLDMACVDVFGTMSYEYISLLGDSAPAPIVNLAPSVQIFCESSPAPPDPSSH